jgi:hypothetical protein
MPCSQDDPLSDGDNNNPKPRGQRSATRRPPRVRRRFVAGRGRGTAPDPLLQRRRSADR